MFVALLALGTAGALQAQVPAQAQVDIQVPQRPMRAAPAPPGTPPGTPPNTRPSAPPNPSSSPLVGRWSESSSCGGTATQFVFTANTFEIIGRDGRWYLANVAYGQRGTELAMMVTAAPTTNRLGPAAPGAGDTYVFRNDPVNRITPLAILRANGRRHDVGNDTPAFTRCR